MATTVFVSPGVFTREQDFSVFASRIGITRLGVVGQTLKGPAFEPIKVSTADEFLARFGSTDSTLELPYVANAFLKQSGELTITRILGGDGFTNSAAWVIQASGGSKSGSTLAVIRSKSADDGISFIASLASDVKIGVITNILSSFILSGSTGPLTAQTNGLIVSLDETRDDYIVKVLGKNPKKLTNDYGIYVESIYPHFIREASSRGLISSINSSITFSNNVVFTDYTNQYTTPETPWIVSRVVGSNTNNLFKFVSVSDGDSANKEIKISISSIDEITKTFDITIRNYNDTDSTAFQSGFERFRGVTLDSTQPNYIAKLIGTTDEEFPRKSTYVTVTLAENHPEDTIPGGFRGYTLRSSGISGNTAPDIFYKTSYLSGDSVTKTFLGISELGYTGFTTTQVSTLKAVKTLEHDLFVYQGGTTSGTTTIKGFHLESNASTTDFVVGDKVLSAYTKSERKFTLVPAGGFDGWNKYRDEITFTSSARDLTNVAEMKSGIDTMANSEEIDVNLFAVPGMNYDENEGIVKYALNMIEERADALYIIDAPRLTVGQEKGLASDVVSTLQDTGIDSNYAATYWPWIQIQDQNTNKFVYTSPTSEVVRTIALTDNVSFPWFAPAGINRGTFGSNIVRADIKLTKDDRDTLYEGGINPIATFVQQGIVIFGQKTLQVKQSALDRINIRRLLLQVRRLIAAASQTLLFEQNDQTLRDQFLAKVEPLLLQIQNQRGLFAFKVIMDDSNNTPDVIDRNTLNGKILLKPSKTLEFLSLDFSVLPTGANFQDF